MSVLKSDFCCKLNFCPQIFILISKEICSCDREVLLLMPSIIVNSFCIIICFASAIGSGGYSPRRNWLTELYIIRVIATSNKGLRPFVSPAVPHDFYVNFHFQDCAKLYVNCFPGTLTDIYVSSKTSFDLHYLKRFITR